MKHYVSRLGLHLNATCNNYTKPEFDRSKFSSKAKLTNISQQKPMNILKSVIRVHWDVF